MLTTSTVQIHDCSVYYRTSDGRAPTLLFISGGVVDHGDLTWKPAIEKAAKTYRVWAPDLPGFGRSRGLPPMPYTTDYVVQFIRTFIRQFDLERPFLLINSMSSAAGLRIAHDYPDEIRGLVLSGAYGWRPRVPFHRLAYRFAHMPNADAWMRRVVRVPGVVRAGLRLLIEKSESLTAELLSDGKLGAAAPDAPTAFLDWLRDELLPDEVKSDFRSSLPMIDVPVLILQGEFDWLAPPADARAAAAALPRATYHEFDTRHLIPREKSDAVIASIFSFIERNAYTE